MQKAAAELDFEAAAVLSDKIDGAEDMDMSRMRNDRNRRSRVLKERKMEGKTVYQDKGSQ